MISVSAPNADVLIYMEYWTDQPVHLLSEYDRRKLF